ncbi:MAG: hypothetical protein JW699_07760 [Chitinispirillaceae bacterium]|nr:hypothetical protein [Chitinispirillaceae bacterium]
MPQPDVRSQIVAGPLQGVSVAYRNMSYIGASVFPIIERVGPKAKITKYPKGAWFRDEAGIRAASTEARRGGYPLSSDPVALEEYAFAKEVTDEDRRDANAAGAPPVQPEQDAVEFAADKIDLRKERLVAELIKATTWADGNASGGEDAGGLWAAGTGNTFLADIRNGCAKIHSLTGQRPNRLLIDYGTFLSLKEESTVLDKIKYTERGVLTADLLAALLELEKVMIGDAVYSTAKENKAGTDFTAAKIWEYNAGKGMGFLYHAPARPGLKVPCAGYQCRGAYEGGMARRIEMWREPSKHQDVFEVAEETDIVVTGSDLGYLWKDTLLT